MKAKKILGKKVITVKEGKEIQKIEDVIFDPSSNRVMAFLIERKGLFSPTKVIPFESVTHFGEDAVMIESETSLKKVSEMPKHISKIANNAHYLTNTKVVTENGRELGEVSDIYFRDDTGMVEEIEVSAGGGPFRTNKKTVSVMDIISIGKNTTVVKESSLESQSSKKK